VVNNDEIIPQIMRRNIKAGGIAEGWFGVIGKY
jgi:hypothetical protein